MFKKIFIATILFVFLTITSVQAQTNKLIEPGVLPDNPIYFLERMGENIRTFFTFGQAKTERYVKLAEERLAEVKNLSEKGKLDKVEETIKEYEKNIDKALNKKGDKDKILSNLAYRYRVILA